MWRNPSRTLIEPKRENRTCHLDISGQLYVTIEKLPDTVDKLIYCNHLNTVWGFLGSVARTTSSFGSLSDGGKAQEWVEQ